MRCDASHLVRATLTPLALSTALLVAGAATAQGSDHQPSPHAQHIGREIKALSPQEIEGLLEGEGMGLALAAELNGYPGPKHVLELADELGLEEEQRVAVERARDAMLAEAVPLGQRVVDAERRLDALFAGAQATESALRESLDEIGSLQAALRHAHLAAHLETRALLTEAQVHRYIHLRGYAGDGHGHSHHHGAHRDE